jgi:hypothetical protein
MLSIDTPYGEISFGRRKWEIVLANVDAIRRFVDEGKPKPAARPTPQPQPRQTQPAPQRATIQTTPFSLVRTTPADPLNLPRKPRDFSDRTLDRDIRATNAQLAAAKEADDDDILGVSFLM